MGNHEQGWRGFPCDIKKLAEGWRGVVSDASGGHILWEQGVASSNPATPTIDYEAFIRVFW